MIRVGWRSASHPQDQSLIDQFICAHPHTTQRKRAEHHPEHFAVEVQSRLRSLLKPATRNSHGLDWRYLIAIDDAPGIAAAFVHRRAPEIAKDRLPVGTPARLLVACAVRLDLRGAQCAPSGEGLADQLVRIALDDAARNAAGGLLFAEVDPRNLRMQSVLRRNDFDEGGVTGDGHLLFAALLRQPQSHAN